MLHDRLIKIQRPQTIVPMVFENGIKTYSNMLFDII